MDSTVYLITYKYTTIYNLWGDIYLKGGHHNTLIKRRTVLAKQRPKSLHQSGKFCNHDSMCASAQERMQDDNEIISFADN